MTIFYNRTDAAKQLLKQLEKYKNKKDVIILAIPRGGVPIGTELSKGLSAPLDVFFTKKIPHPHSEEFAIGIVGINCESIDEKLTKEEDISQKYIQKEIKRIRKDLVAQEQLYRKDFKQLNLKDKTVILTDDGVATGKTLTLTLQLIKKHQPKKIIVAIPVGPSQAKDQLKKIADEVIFLQTPTDFFAISLFYQDFTQVQDNEAIQLLKENHGN